MLDAYITGQGLLTPLGQGPEQNLEAVLQRRSAVARHQDAAIDADPFYAARLRPEQSQMLAARYAAAAQLGLSPFEHMALFALEEALDEADVAPGDDDLLVILSSTKGNIEWLGQKDPARVGLQSSAERLARWLGLARRPWIVSHACISGTLALAMAARLLRTGRYAHVAVLGCDRFSGFVHNGFKALHALSDGPCRPFDKDRSGINLGEASACMVLSAAASPMRPGAVRLSGGASGNDAHHLSAPSRSGEELARAIGRALSGAGLSPGDIGMVSAHGTATLFNDEMEAKALALAGLAGTGAQSLKGYFGHTLGAAGVLESILSCMAMQRGLVPGTMGLEHSGVAGLSLLKDTQDRAYGHLLKTSSGFGGCNAALVWSGGPMA